LAKFASKIHVSTHRTEATEARRRPSAILSGVDRERYRRRQRRRAIIGWSTFALVAVVAALVVIFGSEEAQRPAALSSSMTSGQYVAIHKGEPEAAVVLEVGGPGLQESEVEGDSLLGLFPDRPPDSVCSYWGLSDAPGHLARLCFGEAEDLVQKSVAAMGDAEAPTTLV
jgi:hypothetical protein